MITTIYTSLDVFLDVFEFIQSYVAKYVLLRSPPACKNHRIVSQPPKP